jgi:hypothetical protein
MTFQPRNFAMVARIRLLLPPVRPDLFTVLHVLHYDAHFLYVAVRVDASHAGGLYCVVGDSMSSTAGCPWDVVRFRLSLMVQAVVSHYGIPPEQFYCVYRDVYAHQVGADCWLFAGPFAARRLCGATFEPDGIFRMPVCTARYTSQALRKRVVEQLRQNRVLAAPIGWVPKFPSNPSKSRPPYIPTLERDGVQIFPSVLSSSDAGLLYRLFARDRASVPPWVPSAFGQARHRAERFFLLQAKKIWLRRIGGSEIVRLTEKVYNYLETISLTHPARATLLGVMRIDAHPDSAEQHWHRDYPWHGKFLPVAADEQEGASGHVYELTVNISPVRIYMAAVAGSHSTTAEVGTRMVIPVEPGDMVLLDMLTVHKGLAYIGTDAKECPPLLRLMASQVYRVESSIGKALADAWDKRDSGESKGDESWDGAASEMWGAEHQLLNVDILGNIHGAMPDGLHVAAPFPSKSLKIPQRRRSGRKHHRVSLASQQCHRHCRRPFARVGTRDCPYSVGTCPLSGCAQIGGFSGPSGCRPY